MAWGSRIAPEFDLERHRVLLISALHSHVEALDKDQDMALSLPDGLERSSERNRIVRERADALDLARELECS